MDRHLLKEAFEAVQELNTVQPDDASPWHAVTLHTDGYNIFINLADSILLWNDDEDTRQYDENTHTYEPLLPFLKKRIQEELTKFNQMYRL